MRGMDATTSRISPACVSAWAGRGGTGRHALGSRLWALGLSAQFLAFSRATSHLRAAFSDGLGDVQRPEQVAGRFAEDGDRAAPCSLGAGVGPGCHVYLNAFMLEQLAN